MVRAEEGAQSRVWYDFVCKLLCLGLLGSGRLTGASVRCSSYGSVLGADACSALTLLLLLRFHLVFSLPFATGRNPK